MLTDLSANTRIRLAESLPILDRHKEEIVTRLAAQVSRDSEGRQENADLVSQLVECLVDEARAVVDTGRFARAEVARQVSEQLDVGPTLSHLGDALVPIIKDIVGPSSARQTAAAWSDTFWAVFSSHERRSTAIAA
jgi:hypothetical protein